MYKKSGLRRSRSESYLIISADAAEPEVLALAQAYYAGVGFASQLCSEFAASGKR
jgi:hypothetical protein